MKWIAIIDSERGNWISINTAFHLEREPTRGVRIQNMLGTALCLRIVMYPPNSGLLHLAPSTNSLTSSLTTLNKAIDLIHSTKCLTKSKTSSNLTLPSHLPHHRPTPPTPNPLNSHPSIPQLPPLSIATVINPVSTSVPSSSVRNGSLPTSFPELVITDPVT